MQGVNYAGFSGHILFLWPRRPLCKLCHPWLSILKGVIMSSSREYNLTFCVICLITVVPSWLRCPHENLSDLSRWLRCFTCGSKRGHVSSYWDYCRAALCLIAKARLAVLVIRSFPFSHPDVWLREWREKCSWSSVHINQAGLWHCF